MESSCAKFEIRSARLPTIKNFRKDDNNKSVSHSFVTSDEDEPIDQSQDVFTRRPVRGSIFSLKKKPRIQDGKRKKARLDDSTTSSTELRDSENLDSRKGSEKPSYSTREQPERKASESTAYQSVTEDSGFESNILVPIARESRNKRINADIDNRVKLDLILPVLEHFKDARVAEQYTRTMHWHDTMEKTAVDTIVELASAPNGDGETAELCKRAAIETIDKVYVLISEALRTGLGNETVCINCLELALTLCDSSPICEESVKFFISKLVSPESREDGVEPEGIVEALMQLDQARFVLFALIETLKKYVKMREKSSCEMEIRKRHGPNAERFDTDYLIADRDTRWSETLSIYAAANLNSFPLLTKMAWRGVELLRGSKFRTV